MTYLQCKPSASQNVFPSTLVNLPLSFSFIHFIYHSFALSSCPFIPYRSWFLLPFRPYRCFILLFSSVSSLLRSPSLLLSNHLFPQKLKNNLFFKIITFAICSYSAHPTNFIFLQLQIRTMGRVIAENNRPLRNSREVPITICSHSTDNYMQPQYR